MYTVYISVCTDLCNNNQNKITTVDVNTHDSKMCSSKHRSV